MGQTPKAVAVTGAAGYIGKRIVQRLLDEDAVQRIVAVDVQPTPFAHPKLTYLRQDINSPLDTAFRNAGVTAVVHLAFVMRQLRNRRESLRVNVEGARNVLRACSAADVGRIVLPSSFSVYGPLSDGSPPFTEDSPLRPPAGFHYAEDKAVCERLCGEYVTTHPGVDLTVLRSCIVMGPNARNSITTALNKPFLLGVRGTDPPWQFVHEDDLVELLWEAVSKPRPGVFNVAGGGSVCWSEVASLAGKRMIMLPPSLARGLLDVTWRLRLQSDSPSVGLDFIRRGWTVSTERLEREFDHKLRHTSRAALLDYLAT